MFAVAIVALVDADLPHEIWRFFQAHQLRFSSALRAVTRRMALFKGTIGVFRRPSRHPRIDRL